MSFTSVYFFSPVAELVWLSIITGFITYLSFPLFYWKSFVESRAFVVFNAAAVGILIFLLLDIFTAVNEVLFQSAPSADGLVWADPLTSVAFLLSTIGAFLLCYWTEGEEGEEASLTGDRTAMAVAVGIGFQNLTEGLALGVAWYNNDLSLAAVIVLGYSVQNLTEGFPIVAAYTGGTAPGKVRLAVLFFIRGIPTVIGGLVGFLAVSWFSNNVEQANVVSTLVNGLAIGAILYCILPILLETFQPLKTPEATALKRKLVFLGVALGFIVGFAVGLFPMYPGS